LVGLSACIALIGEEFVNGLNSLPTVALSIILAVEVALALGWLAARQSPRHPFRGVPHFVLAGVLATLLVLLVESPTDVEIELLPTVVFALLVTIIIEVIAVATDKADLLNRLADD
jgi:hypothetical protein